ncbi:asparagine synthase C-terminal domain-containing protein [Coralloluteibacterium stylophorae]|uniref:asparagine synthase (glutamine-hydrolyzing) n=1 Tax=Coralloluteibacterium stylophorae TaxID=1776034 RepID=A0A8J8AXK6_9GAMM|nr:asparagine synthase C-terminal domain-containing protein [Coralloluteibacterium stylophorae]MBS7456837.1 asparagine synthase [Coralloluteibacterium stylophorae]
MAGAYLAVLGRPGDELAARAADVTRRLESAGMREHHAGACVSLLGSADLRRWRLPGGAVLIGDLFTRDGQVADPVAALRCAVPADVRRRILRDFWGSYLLIQPEADALIVTLSPTATGHIPCVYAIADGCGFLTSDISLAARAGLHERRVDWDSIAHRLAYPGIKTQRTGLRDVLELLPGTSLRVEPSRVSVDQAWSPWAFVAPAVRHTDPHEAACDVRRAVAATVGAWASMDGTVLLELSGGLDSSIVAACLADSPARVVCVNLVTPVPGVDERHYAQLMADALGVPLHTETLPFERARLEFVPAPESVSPGMGPLQHAIDGIMEEAAERHGATSFYSGGGGDSVFCYLRTAAPAADAFAAQGPGAGLAAVRDLAALHQCTFWKAGRLTLSKLRRAPSSPTHRAAAFLAPAAADIAPLEHPWSAAPDGALPGDRERIVDLAGNQLFQGQAARGARRPFRFPLLSQPAMEACLRTPSWMWIAGGRNRAVARDAFADRLPADVLHRQSKATYMSYLGVVYQQNRRTMRDFLLSGRLAGQGLLDTRAIAQFLAADDLPARDQTFLRLFELCMVENWVRHQP